MPYSHWKLVLEPEKEEAARRVLNNCLTLMPRPAMDVSLARYHKGGHAATFYFYHNEDKEWSHALLEAIEFGQLLGGAWTLLGSVRDDPSGVLSRENPNNRISVPGLAWATWELTKEKDT